METRLGSAEQRTADCETKTQLRILIVGAALRKDSLNVRLARLAAQIATSQGAIARLAAMTGVRLPAIRSGR